jgi:hypothetical protein
MSKLSALVAMIAVTTTLGVARPVFAQTPGSPPAAQPSAPPQPPSPPPQPPYAAPPSGAQQLPPPPPPPASAVAPNGEYVAPMSQTTQPSYLPQSVALSGPRMLKEWEVGEPIPYGYHPATRVRKGMLIAGAIVFGVTYLYSAGAASVGGDLATSSGGDNKAAALYVPVFGPFIELGQTDSSTLRYILVLDGLAQGIGAAMFIYGIAVPKNVLVRNDLAMVTVTPMRFGNDGSGLGLVGRF